MKQGPIVLVICGEIGQDIEIDCNNPLQAGTEDEMLVINRNDWLDAVFTVDPQNDQIVSNIILPSGARAYRYQGKNNSIAPKMELVKSQFSENYNHEINFKVFKVDAATKDELEKLDKGEYVVLIHNKYKGASGASAFEIYGGDAGVITSQNIREGNNVELGGAFDIILKSNENSLEPHMPKTFFDTNFNTTKTKFDALAV